MTQLDWASPFQPTPPQKKNLKEKMSWPKRSTMAHKAEKFDSKRAAANMVTIRVQIPKPNETEGLGIGWPQQKLEMDELKALAEQIKSKM